MPVEGGLDAYTRAMEGFFLIYRVVALGIIAFWAAALVQSLGKPPDWEPRGYSRRGVPRISRDRYRLAACAGILAGLAVLAFSFVLPTL
jgi:hypothetical protein